MYAEQDLPLERVRRDFVCLVHASENYTHSAVNDVLTK